MVSAFTANANCHVNRNDLARQHLRRRRRSLARSHVANLHSRGQHAAAGAACVAMGAVCSTCVCVCLLARVKCVAVRVGPAQPCCVERVNLGVTALHNFLCRMATSPAATRMHPSTPPPLGHARPPALVLRKAGVGGPPALSEGPAPLCTTHVYPTTCPSGASTWPRAACTRACIPNTVCTPKHHVCASKAQLRQAWSTWSPGTSWRGKGGARKPWPGPAAVALNYRIAAPGPAPRSASSSAPPPPPGSHKQPYPSQRYPPTPTPGALPPHPACSRPTVCACLLPRESHITVCLLSRSATNQPLQPAHQTVIPVTMYHHPLTNTRVTDARQISPAPIYHRSTDHHGPRSLSIFLTILSSPS